ncbi:hypothetical protein [Candidatus Similichlamydia epinepheli]|uniref:hypothetical protein n=1 Tax=Candidatus Similichlamydia epinepheli TaxID=1903953 RepID=UPI000D33AFB1|nr:hypothetical protein [Candidatus Similichlamydia epinepheli]
MQSKFNSYIFVKVDVSSTSSLDWDILVRDSCLSIGDGKKIFWELIYEVWNDDPLSDVRLSAIRFALEAFLESVLPSFIDKTEGFVFYRGNYNHFSKHESYLETFATLNFALPQELERWFLLECGTESLLDRLFYFSELSNISKMNFLIEGEWSTVPFMRFQNGNIFRSSSPSTTGVCISKQVLEHEESRARLVNYLQNLDSAKYIRWIHEKHLNEQWDLLDQLILFSKSTHLQRSLEGFEAAGGNVKKIF